MSTVKANNHQVGQSVTATNNFTLYQPATPDGTVRLGVGNTGATTLDAVTVTNAGSVGIGTSSPTTILNAFSSTAAANIRVTSQGFNAAFSAFRYDTSANGPTLNFNKFRGTLASPTAVANGDLAGTVAFLGYGGTNSRTIAGINGVVETYTSDTNISGYLSFLTNSGGTTVTEVGRFTAAGNFQFNSGYGSVATAYGCRAWVNFNGTGTVAIRASGNVSSITDNGVGDYTINYTNAMPDANYAVAGQGQYDTTSATTNNTGTSISRTASAISTSSVRINTQATGSGALLDFLNVCVVIFR